MISSFTAGICWFLSVRHVVGTPCTLFATEEGPFGAETFCQGKLFTTCLTLKNQQIPIYRCGNESLLYHLSLCSSRSKVILIMNNISHSHGNRPLIDNSDSQRYPVYFVLWSKCDMRCSWPVVYSVTPVVYSEVRCSCPWSTSLKQQVYIHIHGIHFIHDRGIDNTN